jgi:hypothetical protein
MRSKVRDVGVAGSNPVTPTIFRWSIPGTWVTVYTGHMGTQSPVPHYVLRLS